METRKVQRLGPSTLAMTLPAEWAREHDVAKGDEVSLRAGGDGTLTVVAASAGDEATEATVRADDLGPDGLERAVVAQYVLGRRVIHVTNSEGVLDDGHINAVYGAQSQLMGLGVIEETPETIAIRCSVDPDDFTLDNLLQRLESTGRTMRTEAVKALAHGTPDLAERALNRERQANRIFVLLLSLILTAARNPRVARAVGFDSDFPLVGYRSVAKNLELTADNAEDIAEICLSAGDGDRDHRLDVDESTIRRVREFTDTVDEITATAVESVVARDYDRALEVRRLFDRAQNTEREILSDLPELENETLLEVREVLVALKQTTEYGVRNAEIAANLALDRPSAHVDIGPPGDD